MGRGPGASSVLGFQITAVDDGEGGQLPSIILTNGTNVSRGGTQTLLGDFNKLPALPPQISEDGNTIIDIGTNIQNPTIGNANPNNVARRFKATAVGSAASLALTGSLGGNPRPADIAAGAGGGYAESYEYAIGTNVNVNQYDDGEDHWMGYILSYEENAFLPDVGGTNPRLTNNGVISAWSSPALTSESDTDKMYLAYLGQQTDPNYSPAWFWEPTRGGTTTIIRMYDGADFTANPPTKLRRADTIWGVGLDFASESLYAGQDRIGGPGRHADARYYTFTDATAPNMMYEFSEPYVSAAQISYTEQDGSETAARGMLVRASFGDMFDRQDNSYTLYNPGIKYSTTEAVNSGYIRYTDANLLSDDLTVDNKFGTPEDAETNSYKQGSTFPGYGFSGYYNVNANQDFEYSASYISIAGAYQAVDAPLDAGGNPTPGDMKLQWAWNYTMAGMAVSETKDTRSTFYSASYDVPFGGGAIEGLSATSVMSGKTAGVRTDFNFSF